MRIQTVSPLGFCPGAKRAIDIFRRGVPLESLGQILHKMAFVCQMTQEYDSYLHFIRDVMHQEHRLGRVEDLVEKVAKREGFGALLADGVRKVADRIGHGAWEYAIHVGGQDLGFHDPRQLPARGAG